MCVQVVAMNSIKSEQASLFTITTFLKYNFVSQLLKEDGRNRSVSVYQFVILKSLSYCFKGTIGFDTKASFVSGPASRVIKPGDITK